ncbi:hypothetical protein HZS_3040 [Henneguya salminicola]|nr:hypothetical protein HZS_3040 [Henneguya salminicola]
MRCIVEKLPEEFYINLKYLIKFLVKVVKNSPLNKMTAYNVGIVIGPNLISNKDIGNQVSNTSASAAVCECLITDYNYIFKGISSFFILEKPEPKTSISSTTSFRTSQFSKSSSLSRSSKASSHYSASSPTSSQEIS